MNCETIQNRILAQADLAELPDKLRGHVESCPACTAWWNQAIQIDQLVCELPVPPAPGRNKAAMLRELASPPSELPSPVESPAGRAWSRRGLGYIAALAASVLVVIGGWLSLRPTPQPAVVVVDAPRHPLLDTISGRIVALSSARSQTERMEILGSLAGDISTESGNLARIAGEDELKDLSGWFKHVVDDGLVKQARNMNQHSISQSQKKELLGKLAARLAEAEREADRIAAEAPPHAQVELRKIANTARHGQAELREILTREEA